jgi:hypothetical protein
MNIFFTGAVSGGRAQQPNYERIVAALAAYGTVYSRHVQDDTLSEYGETSLTPAEILNREQDQLGKSDVVVAEVTTPSLGVGYLLALASSFDKRIIALYQGDDSLKLSALIKGDPRIEVITYKTDDDFKGVLDASLRGR